MPQNATSPPSPISSRVTRPTATPQTDPNSSMTKKRLVNIILRCRSIHLNFMQGITFFRLDCLAFSCHLLLHHFDTPTRSACLAYLLNALFYFRTRVYNLLDSSHLSYRLLCTPPSSSRTTRSDMTIEEETMKSSISWTLHPAATLMGTDTWIRKGIVCDYSLPHHQALSTLRRRLTLSSAADRWSGSVSLSIASIDKAWCLQTSSYSFNPSSCFLLLPVLVLASRGARCAVSAECSVIEAAVFLLRIFSRQRHRSNRNCCGAVYIGKGAADPSAFDSYFTRQPCSMSSALPHPGYTAAHYQLHAPLSSVRLGCLSLDPYKR